MRAALLLLSSVGVAATVPWILASCATVDSGGDFTDPPTYLPETGAVDGGAPAVDAAPDAGSCDASNPDCVTTPISCAEADWCPVPTGTSALYALTAVWGSSAGDVWAAGSGGTIIHWDGAVWAPLPAPESLKNTFRVVWGSGPNDVWVATATDLVFHSDGIANGTTTWTHAPNPTGDQYNTAPIYSGWGAAAGAPRFGARTFTRIDSDGNWGSGNQVVASARDGGVDWVLEPGSATVNGIWGASADDVWLVGDNSGSVPWQLGWTAHGVRDSGGQLVWSDVDSQAGVVLHAVWGSSASDVWAVGDTGVIRHIGAGASQWEVSPSPTGEVLHAVWGSSASDVWAVGDSGTILHWDGAIWKPSVAAFELNRTRPHLYGIWGSGPNDVWIVGDGVALHFAGGAK